MKRDMTADTWFYRDHTHDCNCVTFLGKCSVEGCDKKSTKPACMYRVYFAGDYIVPVCDKHHQKEGSTKLKTDTVGLKMSLWQQFQYMPITMVLIFLFLVFLGVCLGHLLEKTFI